MKNALRVAACLLAVAALSACGQSESVTQATPSVAPAAPAASATPAPASPAASDSTAPSTLNQTYQEPSGAFQISLPDSYEFEETDTGLIFRSADQIFRGEVVFGSAEGEQYNNDQLESFLKEAYKTNLQLTEVDWQQTEVQPDGSLRIDWVGVDPQGNRLDAESFIEQRGDFIYILTLSGVNQPYANYIADAQAIVGSYQVRQQ